MNRLTQIKNAIETMLQKAARTKRENYVLWSAERSDTFAEMQQELFRKFLIQTTQFLRNPEVEKAVDKRTEHQRTFDSHERIYTEQDKQAVLAIIEKHMPKLKDLLGETALIQYYVYFANRGGQAALNKRRARQAKKAEIVATFNLKNHAIIGKLAKRANLLIESVDQTTKKWLANQILNGEEDQLSWKEIADNVRQVIPDYYKGRAETIVKTEVAEIVNDTEQETAIRNEATTKVWTAAGMNICDDCETNDGEEVGINEAFPSGDDRPPVHPNCKCLLEYNYPTLGTFTNEWTGD